MRAGRGGAQALSVLLLPLASVIIFFSFPIVAAWTGNATIARNTAPLVTVLSVGMSLNALMAPVYALQLAAGATRLALKLVTIGHGRFAQERRSGRLERGPAEARRSRHRHRRADTRRAIERSRALLDETREKTRDPDEPKG